jgi:hypothetical protein
VPARIVALKTKRAEADVHAKASQLRITLKAG